MFEPFPFVAQHDAMDCGPACLAMVARKYGKKYPLQFLRDQSFLTKEGVSLSGISQAASLIGFESLSVKTSFQSLIEQQPLPCILFWNNGHFVVLYQIKRRLFSTSCNFKIADPSVGLITVSENTFKDSWMNQGDKGIAFLLEPTDLFYKTNAPEDKNYKLINAFKYLKPYKKRFLSAYIGPNCW